MASRESLETRQLAKRGVVNQIGTDDPVAIRIEYVGPGSVNSVTVNNSGDSVDLDDTDGGSVSIDATGSEDLGDVVDDINAQNNWNAKLLDALRSQAAQDTLVDGAVSADTTLDGETVYDLSADTDSMNKFTARLTFDRGFERVAHKDSHRVKIQEIFYNINLGSAGANNVKIYEVDDSNEVEIFSAGSVDNTDTTINFASGNGVLTARDGNDLVVEIADGGTLSDAAANVLRVTGELE